jgi:hypothetical protein
MKMTLPIKTIFTPSSLSMMAVAFSLIAWLFPDFGVLRKGFIHRESLDMTATVMLLCWYAMIFICFVVGQKLGELVFLQRRRPLEKPFSLESNLFYGTFTFLAALGTGSTLVRIFTVLPLREALVYVSLGQTNALKDTLYQDYSIGLVSLRYLVLYPSAIALYRIIRYKRYSFLNLFNVFHLAVGTFLGSRLILMATLVMTAFLLTYGRRSVQISIPKIALWTGFLFLVLALLNLSRNADYYERNNLSFGLAGVSEILAYAGSPFQAAVGSAKVADQLAGFGGDQYRDYVDIEVNLNTNSAFTLLLQQMGYTMWPYFALVCLVMGFLFAALASLGRTVFLLPCGAILYASAEIWRLDLFQQGTFIIWLVAGAGIPAALLFQQRVVGILNRAPRSAAISGSYWQSPGQSGGGEGSELL